MIRPYQADLWASCEVVHTHKKNTFSWIPANDAERKTEKCTELMDIDMRCMEANAHEMYLKTNNNNNYIKKTRTRDERNERTTTKNHSSALNRL